MRITFQGATRQVTGSAHLLEIGPHRILLDCGLFDSDRMGPDSPNRHFDFDPTTLDAVIVSHAHNDHIGRLPLLVRRGYRGPIYMTPPTADITGIMLRDSARIQREDARQLAQRHDATGANGSTSTSGLETSASPLFDLMDVEWVIESLHRLRYNSPIEILDGIELTLHNAGHILGSAMIQLDFREEGRRRRFLFTGDLGRLGMGLLPDPSAISDVDILVSESTYGNRELDSYQTLIRQLHAITLRAIRNQSKIVIPAFSLGRTQRMIYCFKELFTRHKVKEIPLYVDSPLSLRLTEVHRDHPDYYTDDAKRLMDNDPDYFWPNFVEFTASNGDSRRLNYRPGPCVIVASSGMCEAGRVRHHLRHVVEDEKNAVVIVSYQAEGTLGRKIADGNEQIPIMDNWYDLNCAVYVLDGFSGHADRADLATWYAQTGGDIEHAFLVHGEPEGMDSLLPVLQPHVKNRVIIPERLNSFEV